MAKPQVFVTRKIPSPGLEILSDVCTVELHGREDPPTREELKRGVKGKDGLLCLLTDKIDAEVMEAGGKLRVVSSFSVGYDHIDVKEATKRGIYVCYTPGVLTEATADFAFALLMSISRRIAEADKYVRDGKWKIGWTPTMFLGEDVYGRTLGILGLGRIGRTIAKRAKGFDMRLMYYDVVRATPETEKELGIEFVSLERLLRESDYVSIHVSLSNETRHIINEERLKAMKRTAYIINTARGAVVDQVALAKALKEGWIAGAALDVFEKEPIDLSDPLIKLDNVILVPHIASATKAARSKMAETSARNLVAVLKGEAPPFLVNGEVMNVRPLTSAKMV